MQDVSSLDYDKITDRITRFISGYVRSAGADGVIFGLSGGIDSAVTAHLCCMAVGADRCLALIMPNDSFTPASETDDGVLVAKKLEIKHKTVPIGEISDSFTAADPDRVIHDKDTMARVVGNLNARIRANCLYYEGQKRNYLVVGTDDKSEYMIGYFTKHGDGASDMMPIVGLYKTQVWELGMHLGVPPHIVAKKPSPHLWPGHNAHDELGMEYNMIDRILVGVYDQGEDPVSVASTLGIEYDKVKNIVSLVEKNSHKRSPTPAADPYGDD